MRKAILERQNKELHARLENLAIKFEKKEIESQNAINALKVSSSEKDEIIANLQNEIVSLTILNENLHRENEDLKRNLDLTQKENQRLASIIERKFEQLIQTAQ